MRSNKLLCLATVLGLCACGPKVASIDVTPKSAELNKKGDAVTLVATPKNAEGAAVSGVTLGFTSSDPAVATVDPTGKVTAVKSGDAKVTVSFEKVSSEVPVKVSIPASVAVSPPEVKLDGVGTRTKVSAKVLDEKGAEVKAPITWESSDPKVATVQDGEITSVGAGEAQVSAVAAGLRSAVKVTVAVPQVASIEADKTVDLKVGDAPAKLKAVAKDADGKEIASAQLTYSVDNAKVATVDAAGMVTAVGKGAAKVTIASGDKSATVDVKVKQK